MPGMTNEEINQTLNTLPIPESNEDLKKEIESVVPPIKPAEVEVDFHNDPKSKKEYTFELNYKDNSGKIWSGKFTTKILNIGERQMAGALRSRYSGNTPLESMDISTVLMNIMLDHLTYSITQKANWCDNLRELHDPGIIEAIYEEVASHEEYFLGWEKNTKKSEG